MCCMRYRGNAERTHYGQPKICFCFLYVLVYVGILHVTISVLCLSTYVVDFLSSQFVLH